MPDPQSRKTFPLPFPMTPVLVRQRCILWIDIVRGRLDMPGRHREKNFSSPISKIPTDIDDIVIAANSCRLWKQI
jgi:hypothetical protein